MDREIPTLAEALRVLPTTLEAVSDVRRSFSAPPASAAWINLRARVSLSVYYQPDEDTRIAEMALTRWEKVLSEIPGPLVAYAFDQWERTREHRPTPASIASIARARRRTLSHEISESGYDRAHLVIQFASDETDTSTIDIRSSRRNRDIVWARDLAILAVREWTGCSYPQIGSVFGDRDHTTIMAAEKRARSCIDSDAISRALYERIEAKCMDAFHR